MPLSREEDFLRNTTQILHFYPKITSLLVWGSWNLQFPLPNTRQQLSHCWVLHFFKGFPVSQSLWQTNEPVPLLINGCECWVKVGILSPLLVMVTSLCEWTIELSIVKGKETIKQTKISYFQIRPFKRTCTNNTLTISFYLKVCIKNKQINKTYSWTASKWDWLVQL